MEVNYKTEREKKIFCDEYTGMLLQNKLVELTKKMGGKIAKEPLWDLRQSYASIVLPCNIEDITEKSFTISMTIDYHSPQELNGSIAVLHELGHLLDCQQHGGLQGMVTSNGYHNMEVEAWENAFQLSHKIGFRYFDVMYREAVRCLYTYFGTEEIPEPHRIDDKFDYPEKPISWSVAWERISMAHKRAKKTVNEVLYA